MMIARAEPILENERRDPQPVEPLGDLLPFVLDGQHPVAAARADHHGRARRQLRARQPDRDRRHVLIRIGPLGPGRTAGPQLDHRVCMPPAHRRGIPGSHAPASSKLANPAKIEEIPSRRRHELVDVMGVALVVVDCVELSVLIMTTSSVWD